jgi:PAS domain S-box-containing protein
MPRRPPGHNGFDWFAISLLGDAASFRRPAFGAIVHPAADWYIVLFGLAALGVTALVLVVAMLRMSLLNRRNERLNVDLERELAERTKAEEALRASEAFYHLLVETLPQNILRKDQNGRFTFANRKFCDSLGKTPEEIVGRTDFDFYPAELAEAYRNDDLRVMDSKCAFETTEENVARDGEISYVHIIKTPIYDLCDRMIGTQCIFWDVTAEKRTELALRKTRERYEVAVQGSKDGLWDWDLETNEVYFSPQWKAMIGFADNELPNEFDSWRGRIHPDDRELTETTVDRYLKGLVSDYELEHRLLHKDGTYRWILARGAALRHDDGTPCRFAGSHTDITSRKHAEKLLREQNERLEAAALTEREAMEALKLAQSRMVQSEKLASLGQMVAGVAHEINNPLSFVGNNIAVLQRDLTDLRELLLLYQEADAVIATERPELLSRIEQFRDVADVEYTVNNLQGLLARSREGLKRIQQIVKDLRLFARIDEGERNEADLNTGIESTITIIHGHAHKKGVTIKPDLHPLPPVNCYPARINQVIMNLLSNAIDATPEGGTVTVRTTSEKDRVNIQIIDTGVGIPPEMRQKIFDPFFTTKPVGQGTGLGLSISYGIVHDHGGTIEVDSTLGEGTTFTVSLPLQSPSRLKPAASCEPSTAAPAPASAKPEAKTVAEESAS